MTKRRSAFALLMLVGGGAAHAQTSPPLPGAWQFDPSAYVLGSLDASTDFPFGGPYEPRHEPIAAPDLGLGLDVSREASRGWLRGSLFALSRSPFSDPDRTFFGAGRIEASRSLGGNGRLTLTDEGKAQTRPAVDVGDYWGNAASLRAEWNRPSGGGFELELDDRRRTLPDLPFLGFSEQGVGGGAFFRWGAKGRAHLGAGVRKYSAPTAEGGRVVLLGELATFTRTGIATFRLAWFEPFSDRRLTPPPAPAEGNEPGEQYDFGEIGRAEFFERLTFRTAYEGIGGLAFMDPLESESDQWDFGRRKLVVAGFTSRNLGAHASVSAFFRYEHKHGPNLLVPAGAEGAGAFTDNRIEARVSASYRLRSRVSLLAQSSYLQNWSTRRALAFERFLLTIGVHIHF